MARITPEILFRQIAQEPYRYDFFHSLRCIECLFPDKPRLGTALLPVDEPVRLAQEPSLIFAPSSLALLQFSSKLQAPRLEVRFFGLLGVNGPLPLHLTEFARERLLHFDDASFARFLDIFNHRFLAFFYRAWAQAQPEVHLDRPEEDRFAWYVGALSGHSAPQPEPVTPSYTSINHYARLFFSGILSRQIRHADGLVALLSGYFKVPVRVEPFIGHWMTISLKERTRLGNGDTGSQLGKGAVLGKRVWDRQHKIRLFIGPLTYAQFLRFLPGQHALYQLVEWLRQYLCFELEWDVCLVLKAKEVPQAQLGAKTHLGWNAWLGKRRHETDAEDLVLRPDK